MKANASIEIHEAANGYFVMETHFSRGGTNEWKNILVFNSIEKLTKWMIKHFKKEKKN